MGSGLTITFHDVVVHGLCCATSTDLSRTSAWLEGFVTYWKSLVILGDSNIALSLSLCCSEKGFWYALGFDAAREAMRISTSRVREESDVRSGGYGKQESFIKPTLLLLARSQ